MVWLDRKGPLLLTETAYEPGMTLPAHSHGSSHLAVLLEGAYLERIGGRVNLYLPGDAVHYDRDVQHDNTFGRRFGRCLNLEVEEGGLSHLEGSYVPAEIGSLLDLKRRPVEGWVAVARSRLGRSPSLSLSLLADQLCVHPASLAKAFRRAFGLSVGQYAKLQRIRLAGDLLIRGEASVAEIALEAGFFDQSHLTNTFQQVTGFTPGSLRRIAHG